MSRFVLALAALVPMVLTFPDAPRAEAGVPGTQSGAPPIRLIVIDAHTQKELGPLPWPRDRHASLVRWLCKAGARAVVLRFYYRDSLGDKGDRDLAAAAKACGKVFVETGRGESPGGWQGPEAWLDSMALKIDGDAPEDVIDAERLQLPFEALARAVRGIGSVDLLVDRDRRYRAMPLVVRHGGRVLPSLGLRVFLAAAGLEKAPLKFIGRDERALGFLTVNRTRELAIANTRVRLDSTGCCQVDLTAPGSGYRTFSFADVLGGRTPVKPFNGAIVIVGADLPGTAIQTELGPKSGVELVADQIAALFSFAGG